MKFINCSYEEFICNLGDKKIVLFGATSAWRYFSQLFPDIDRDVLGHTLLVVDNDIEKQGRTFETDSGEFRIAAPVILNELENYVILITVSLAYQEEICRQLLALNLQQDIECFSLFLMSYANREADNSAVDKYFADRKVKRIPPKIHSFWFSGEEKPDLYKRCVESWFKYCPTFEIIEWNSDNYDVTKNRYMFEAFEHQKWAFVSDYARLDVLNQEGGIYLDMDVELKVSLEPFLYADSFFCRQEDGLLELGSGFGVQKNDPLIKSMLDAYGDRRLIMPNGEIDMTPQPIFVGSLLRENGFEKNHDSQVIAGRVVLSNDYISCYSGPNASIKAKVGIHWHNGGWLDEKSSNLIKKSNEVRETIIEKYFYNNQ